MYDSYEIRFDEYDEPFLAHASGAWKDHKYLMKVPNAFGDGKTLYLYTQKEIDAWKNGKKRTLSNKIRDILGYDERDRAIDARNEHENASKRFQSVAKKMGTSGNTKLDSVRYNRSKERLNQTQAESEAANKAYKRSVVGILDSVKQFFGDALSAIGGRSRKAEEVIQDNADVKLSSIKSDSSAHYQAQKDKDAEAQRQAELNKKADSSAYYQAQKDHQAAKKETLKNQNGNSQKEDTSDIKNMRKVAMKVLRGDLGNGEERTKKLKSMGYDPQKIQVIAGNLNWSMENNGSYEGISNQELEDILKWVK